MKKKIFIDGRAGTTGLRIEERLLGRDDVELLTLPDKLRKDTEARRKIINSSDVVFLCLPDAAAIEAVSLIENDAVTVIDASTAHRTNPAWAYGFPELDSSFEEKIKNSTRIANPGCHASGFIALIKPLVDNGIISSDTPLVCHSITGYSGGGKKMIAEYEESNTRGTLLGAPRQYGITQMHKHLKEMKTLCSLSVTPIFCPIVADFYSGMEVTVPLFANDVKGGTDAVRDVYSKLYTGPVVTYVEGNDEGGFLSAAALSGMDGMQISVHGNDDRILLVARYDNLGKGASGAALQCLNTVLGVEETEGMVI